MIASSPRLRMFAGPNGSGKSTLKTVLHERLLGTYINPDDIEASIRSQGFFDPQDFSIVTTSEEIIRFFATHSLLHKSGLTSSVYRLDFGNGKLNFNDVDLNSYFAAVTADFVRKKLLERRESFSFETVMSSRSKVDLLEKARQLGYRTYLYYVATRDPEINIVRVQNRVKWGGHDVPEDKIRSRYERSLDLLWDAIGQSNRAYIFDNSESASLPAAVWLAEVTDGKDLEFKREVLPAWFIKAVLNKAKVSL